MPTPKPPVPNVIRVDFIQSSATGDTLNTMHIQMSGAIDQQDLIDLDTHLPGEWHADIGAHLNSGLSSDTGLKAIKYTDLTSPTGASLFAPHVDPNQESSQATPLNACVLISAKESYRYRGGHPRLYFSPGSVTDTAPGQYEWSGATLATWTTDMAHFLAAVNGYSYTSGHTGFLCNVHYIDKAVNPVPPYYVPSPVVRPVVQFVPQPRICTQRRRLGPLL